MRQDIYIRWDFSAIRPRSLLLGIAALLLLMAAPELGSENVTLTSYYPAPSGVYNKMTTSSSTYLATNGGSVGIGTTASALALQVAGPVAIDGSGTLPTSLSPGNNGYLYIDNTANTCTYPGIITLSSDPGTVCPAGQYATWTPGLYIEGYSYQNSLGMYVQLTGSVQTSQVWALDTNTSVASWAGLTQDAGTILAIYCCLK